MKRGLLAAAMIAACICGDEARAVVLSDEGQGQALVYPFFTVQQDAQSSSWNTYFSVVNHRPESKAVRVRVREGINGREMASFNLFLSPNDVWTAALVPGSANAASPGRILTADASCIAPVVPPAGIAFSNAQFSGAMADGHSTGLDRTREGYIEIIEMATIRRDSVADVAVRHANGVPAQCQAVLDPAFMLPAADALPPGGGLSGSLTLINVNSGMDAAVNAVALDELASAPFYRRPADAYPGFSAAEIKPLSHVTADGRAYDFRWANGVQAVTSVFMASELVNEFVLDPATASGTDWAVTFPTRAYMPGATAPFVAETFHLLHEHYDRDAAARTETPGNNCSFVAPGAPCPPVFINAAGAFPVAHRAGAPTSVLGSAHGMRLGEIEGFTSGWMRLFVAEGPGEFGRLRSQAASTMTDLATGAVTTGAFDMHGLPWTGFAVRTFRNGTLSCGLGSAVACQGNYGGAFPHRYARDVRPAT